MSISGFRTLLLSALALAIATAASFATTTNITVKVETNVGDMTLELYGDAKPITVTNFLRYIRDGFYKDSIVHRLPPGFVLQGGTISATESNGLNYLSTYPAITNEPGPFPEYSNVKGTIVMAKVPRNPNSATGSWFINLKDNNTGTDEAENLDLQNGGFTVFGRVIDGLDTLEKFVNFQDLQFDDDDNPIDGDDLIVNYDNGLLSQLPFAKIQGGQLLIENLISTKWTILDGPKPVITSGSTGYIPSGGSFTYQITATGAPTTYSVTGDGLPAGLSLDPATGIISGTLTETTPKSLNLTVNATHGSDTGSASLTLGINYPIMTNNVTATGTMGRPFRYQIVATNSPTRYDASGLPPGLSINSTTGLISGTPTISGSPIYVSVSAGNVAATFNATLILSIAAPPVPVLNVSPKLKIKDGVLTLKGSADAGTVKVEVKVGKKAFKKAKGRPTRWSFPVKLLKPGNYKFQVKATNTDGQVTVKSFSVRIGGK